MKNLPAHSVVTHVDEATLRKRVELLAGEVLQAVQGQDIIIVGVLRGSFMFLADMVRVFHTNGLHPRIDFMTLQSYGSGTSSNGNVSITKDISVDIDQASVLVVDDILDSGRTLRFATRHLKNKGASSVLSCCLLDKPSRRAVDIQADFIGFEIPDTFVVGYGLDYDSYYRELPYLGEVVFE